MSQDVDRRLAGICMLAAIVWAAALPLSARAAGQHHESGGTAIAPAVVYALGAAVCHQRPERSFAWGSAPWPVCARCAGIYFGAAAAGVISLARARWRGREARTGARARLALGLAALPSLATLIYEWTTGQAPGNVTRGLAGLPIGVAVIAAIAWAVERGPVQRPEAVR